MPLFIMLGLALSWFTTLPLAWKWALGVRRTAIAVAVLDVLTGLLVEAAGHTLFAADSILLKVTLNWILTLGAAFGLLAYRFYRDPERKMPQTTNVIVSPADGEICYVRESDNGILPVSTKKGRNYTLQELTKTPLQTKEAAVIGVAMSFLDVHVNRAPIAGRITMRKHVPGAFGSLRLPEMVFDNERFTTVIERGDLQVAVVQIASRLVRQIVSFVQDSQEVELGQRIGVIRLGSQVDLVLPARSGLKVIVKPGQRVRAGESVVAVFEGAHQ